MDFRRRQLLGWVGLGLLALLGGLWLLRLDYPSKISTDVLDLVPADGQAPELALVRALASEAQARTVLVELTVDGRPAPAAAGPRFAAALLRAGSFDQAVAIGDTAARDEMGAALFAQRFALLFPRWLAERMAEQPRELAGDAASWLAEDSVHRLERFLEKPEALAFQDLVPADPLLLLPGAVERLKGGLELVQPMARDAAPTLVWARLTASPLSEAGQGPAFAALAAAVAECAREFPGLHAADTGVNRYAAASRARIEREVKWLNTISLLAVLGVALAFIRRVHRGLHLVPVVLLSVLGAWVGTTLVFERVHIMVFALGALLTGVAIDYGFYLFMQPPAVPGEDYWAKVRRLAKPLLASCLTTVAGFALLLFSELPFIRQLGVFVGTGLVCALGAAIVYFSTVRDPFLEAREFGAGSRWPAAFRRVMRVVLLSLWLAALPGLTRLEWRDDIRELEVPSPEVQREDQRIRALLGEGPERVAYVTTGATLAEARQALEKLDAWLEEGGATAVNLGAVIPTAGEAAAAQNFFREQADFPAKLRDALERAGFEASSFEPFFAAYADASREGAGEVAAAVTALQSRLRGPAGLLMRDGAPLSWFVTLVRAPPAGAPPPEARTVSTSQLQSLNRVFAQYRQSALRLSAIGLAIVGVGVLASYGLRDGLRIFSIPGGACLGLFGVLGWLGQPLNLFHLIGAFLGVCLTHNYSIFSATSVYRGEAPPVSVRVSALTTAASFGVLALSSLPVIRALGMTVALMVVGALLVIEFEHLSGLRSKR